MDEQDIELLKTLIDTQNITKTAKKLYTTQSSLTKRIQKMEQDLGCQLFIRSHTGLCPFAPGGDLRFFKDRCFC